MSKKKAYPQTIECEGTLYKLCDFSTFTLRQNKILKSLLKNSIDNLKGGSELETMLSLLNFDNTNELLALLFIEANEKAFKFETYENRISQFDNLPNYEWIGDLFTDFFTIIKPATLIQSSVTFLTAMQSPEGLAKKTT